MIISFFTGGTPMSDTQPPLGPGPSDHLSSFLKIGIGSLPGIGGALNELVTQVIPGVRIQRIENYLRWLRDKMANFDEGVLAAMLRVETAIELFEEGGYQAARAVSAERCEQIATLVANGLTADDVVRLEAMRLLSFLREIDDDQIIILVSKLDRHRQDDAFFDKHRDILDPPDFHLGVSVEAVDRHTVYVAARQKLISLGLLRPRFSVPRKGEVAEFDKETGMLKSSGTGLTPLGRLLLKRIGLADDESSR